MHHRQDLIVKFLRERQIHSVERIVMHPNGILPKCYKLSIFQDYRRHSIVYAVVNLLQNKAYVGCLKSRNILVRYNAHLVNDNIRHTNKNLHAAIMEYGRENFAFVILKAMNDRYYPANDESLLRLEKAYGDIIKPEYNIAPLGFPFYVKQPRPVQLLDRYNGRFVAQYRSADELGYYLYLSENTIYRAIKNNMSVMANKYVVRYGTDSSLYSPLKEHLKQPF